MSILLPFLSLITFLYPFKMKTPNCSVILKILWKYCLNDIKWMICVGTLKDDFSGFDVSGRHQVPTYAYKKVIHNKHCCIDKFEKHYLRPNSTWCAKHLKGTAAGFVLFPILLLMVPLNEYIFTAYSYVNSSNIFWTLEYSWDNRCRFAKR